MVHLFMLICVLFGGIWGGGGGVFDDGIKEQGAGDGST